MIMNSSPLESLKQEALANMRGLLDTARRADMENNARAAEEAAYQALVMAGVAAAANVMLQNREPNDADVIQGMAQVVPEEILRWGNTKGALQQALQKAAELIQQNVRGNSFGSSMFSGSNDTNAFRNSGSRYGSVNANTGSVFNKPVNLLNSGTTEVMSSNNSTTSSGRYGRSSEPVKQETVKSFNSQSAPTLVENNDWVCEEGITVTVINGKEEATGSAQSVSNFTIDAFPEKEPMEVKEIIDRILMTGEPNVFIQANSKFEQNRYDTKQALPPELFTELVGYANTALSIVSKTAKLSNILEDTVGARAFINKLPSIKHRTHLLNVFDYIDEVLSIRKSKVVTTEALYTGLTKFNLVTTHTDGSSYFVYSNELYKAIAKPGRRSISRYSYNGLYNVLTEIFNTNSFKFLHLTVISEMGTKEVIITHTDILEDEVNNNKLFKSYALMV
nr:MAG TPA: hypothetical protein [Caudoviricetes sp.]